MNSQETINLRNRLLAISASLAVGLGLMAIKFIAFYLTNSAAILSDALESIINVVAAGFALASILIAAKKRLPYIPDVPTSAEAGLPDYLMTVWLGVVAPAGTRQPIVERIHALVQGMLKNDSMVKKMANAAIDVMPMSQADFAQFVRDDHARWRGIVKHAGVEPQ